ASVAAWSGCETALLDCLKANHLVGWPYVAFMLHGVAGSDWEPLKRKENCCDMMQHQGGRDWKLSH
ncbi:MAG: hypothetical protein WBM31_21070, partial [Pseudolabrys sp.]